MRHFLLPLFIVVCAFSQAQMPYSKLRLWAGASELQMLSEHGVPVDHGKYKKNTWFISDFSESEIQVIENLGIQYDVLVKDVKKYYQSRLTNGHDPMTPHIMGTPHIRSHNRSACGASGSSITFTDPANFNLGSMGGYFTYAEFISEIDAMVAQYPNLISAKAPIGTFQTHESRPIYWMRISDNPNTNEGEPQVLYTAIHHAREPGSLSQLIYYMWYLLENYGTDPEVTYLVNNTDMLFVPMINPDGYIQNQTTDPNGGGMWRKNRRNNGNGTFGVDLNRNYSYQWGVSGASTNPASDTYAGPNGFSEPETQAMKFLFENNSIQIALNYHTYGDLLLHPFGYDYVVAPDDDLFFLWKDLMVQVNGYGNIQSVDLYPAAGDSDDWAYAGDLTTKPKVYAMTPEVGDDTHGFWPATAEILPLCRENVHQNLTAVHLLHVFGKTQDENPSTISQANGYLKFDVTRLGLTSGTLTAQIIPLGFGISSVGAPKSFSTLNIGQTTTDSIAYTLDVGLQQGQDFQYILRLSNGTYTKDDTLTKIYGTGTTLFADNGSTLNNWTSTSWSTTAADFVSPSTSITDSPGGNYPNQTNRIINLSNSINLSNAIAASAMFYAKWEIEDNYDYCQFEVSTDGGSSWTPLCGKYTNTGSANQDQGNPLYDGFQTTWVREEVDLSDYLGNTVNFRFQLRSDNFVTEDGFYFDDFEISVIEQATAEVNDTDLVLFHLFPNPANQTVKVQLEHLESGTIVIRDASGREVEHVVFSDSSFIIIDISNLPSGMYHVECINTENNRMVERLMVFK